MFVPERTTCSSPQPRSASCLRTYPKDRRPQVLALLVPLEVQVSLSHLRSRTTNHKTNGRLPAPPASKATPQRNGGTAANRGRKSYIEPEDTVGEKETKINNALASLAELGYRGLSTTDLGKLNPTDEYETELQVMSEVRGYFQIAYKVRSSPSSRFVLFIITHRKCSASSTMSLPSLTSCL